MKPPDRCGQSRRRRPWAFSALAAAPWETYSGGVHLGWEGGGGTTEGAVALLPPGERAVTIEDRLSTLEVHLPTS